ncbi:hypothetical protein ACHAW6_011888 [Cyclotella cf. meneghiniana]
MSSFFHSWHFNFTYGTYFKYICKSVVWCVNASLFTAGAGGLLLALQTTTRRASNISHQRQRILAPPHPDDQLIYLDMNNADAPTESNATICTMDQTKDINATTTNQLIFGSVASELFDDIAITLDNLLTEEVSALPLLPRIPPKESVPDGDGGGEASSQLTGEEILLGKLRRVYRKNLDVVESYCLRNIFTIESFSKTKRRKILEHFLRGDEGGGKSNNVEEAASNDVGPSFSNQFFTKFDPPSINEQLPTAQQIIAMDQEILLIRQRLHSEKQRRVKFSRHIDRLNGAVDSLRVVQDALKGKDGDNFDQLQEKIRRAIQGHQELKVWNGRAEEVVQLLDKIKEDRGRVDGGVKQNTGDVKPKSVSREVDEKMRRRVWMEMKGRVTDSDDGAVSHGSKEEIASLLKKLREK